MHLCLHECIFNKHAETRLFLDLWGNDMALQAIRNNVYEVGAAHPERLLYEDLLPLENGTTYNAYMVVGSRMTALIDTVPLIKNKQLIRNIKESELADPDYIVMLRAQEDYAESLPELLYYFPKAKIVCSEQLKACILEQVSIDAASFTIAEDGDTLDLGGKTLQLNVLTYSDSLRLHSVWLEEDRILFSGFIFSAHYSDDNVFATFGSEEATAAKQYYATQIMSIREAVKGLVNYWCDQSVSLIAPAHGPVWQEPKFILELYKKWMNKRNDKEIVIAYVSLYNHTRELVEQIMFGLVRQGFSVVVRDIAEKPDSLLTQSAEVLVDLVQASTLILASSTALGEPHPAASYLAMLVNMMKPKTALYGFAGSKIGVSQTAERLGSLLQLPQAERLPDLFIDGKIDDHEQVMIRHYVDDLGARIRALSE